MVSDEAGQARHCLRGEVPDCMKHICGVDPVVIWVRKYILKTVGVIFPTRGHL